MSDFERLDRATDPIVKVCDIAFVMFQRSNLSKAEKFMADFGLKTSHKSDTDLHMSADGGYGPCYIARQGERDDFLGFGFAVSSQDDLETLAELPESGDIVSVPNYEGAHWLELKDPTGTSVWAVYGDYSTPNPSRKPLEQNLLNGNRRVNDMVRPPAKPSEVLRLGHAVLGRTEFRENARWYIDTFGLIPTDVQTLGDGMPLITFMRCDLGDTPADHHTLVIAQHVTNEFNHCAFETIDMDDIAMGQEHLMDRGYTHAWGIGRHHLGSQIFDYWRDPWGDRFEHYCDSDKFTADHQTQYSEFKNIGSVYQWGPPPPKDFEGKMSLGLLMRAIQNVRKSPTLNFKTLQKMAKLGGGKPRPWV